MGQDVHPQLRLAVSSGRTCSSGYGRAEATSLNALRFIRLENDNVQHELRLTLEAWYAKRHGRRVPFKEILHELMAEKVRAISTEKA